MGGQSTSRWKGKRPRRGTAPGWIRGAFLVTAVSLGGAVFSAACSGEDQLRPPGMQGTTTSSGSGASGATCDDGEQRDCSVTISEHDGVLTCMDGTQSCVGGEWTACSGENMRTRLAPRANQPEDGTAFSISLPADCIDNPCDPSCQVFVEDPATDITIPPVLPPFPWTVGDINGLPPNLASIGTREPCTTAEDCQFDQFCDNPSGLSCSHHPCATGTGNLYTTIDIGLTSSCSPCVQKICDQDPSCCLEDYAGACDHNPCLQGNALKKDCEGALGCVNSVCNSRPGCCQVNCNDYAPNQNAFCATLTGVATSQCSPGTGDCTCPTNVCQAGALCSGTGMFALCKPKWDNQCRTLVTSLCGKSCAPNQWDASCVSMVETECGADCEDPTGTCAHDPCYTGDRLINGCNACVSAICTARPSCCSTRWDQSCVDLVPQYCGNVCPPKGRCTSWLPGESNPSCAGPDLTLGVPCGGTVPVCNRGSAQVPAGTVLDIVSWAPGAGNFPSSAPTEVLNSCNPPPGAPACSTTLAQPLDPGDCVSVAGCNGLAVNSEIMVNPTGAVNECLCENNWSLYRNDACTSPACIASASVAYVKKATMFVAIDASTSMQCTGTSGCPPTATSCNAGQSYVKPQRWNPLRNALTTFFQEPTSAGLGVALRFWPDNSPATCGTSSCGALGAINGCGQPLVPFGTLTADTGAADTQETALVNALAAKTPCGDTPVHNALDGALYWATQRKQANPTEEVMVVFITDGMPTHCNQNGVDIKALAQNAFNTHGVRTHVMGFGESNEAFTVELAQSGGGRSFYLTTGTTASQIAAFQSSIVAAMKDIRGDVLPCDIDVPVDGISDPSQITMVYTSGSGTNTTLIHVADPASCVPNGWYIDPTNPANAKLCPQTCQTVQGDVGAKVQATVPCTTTINPTTHTEVYQAQCPQGSKVQWGLLRWNTTTPSDSNVQFTVRTAETAADLAAAMPHSAGTAQAAPTNTQVCDTSGPAPMCPVDLYNALGGLPEARQDFLELTMTLNPAADQVTAPTVHDWEITYSCPYSE